jgi:hypothetical protein
LTEFGISGTASASLEAIMNEHPDPSRPDSTAPSDTEILAWLLGDLSEPAAASITTWAEQPASAARLVRLRSLMGDLGQARALEADFAAPPAALGRLYDLSSILPSQAPTLATLDDLATWIGRALVERVARLVLDSRSPQAAMGFRGAADEHLLKFEADDMGVAISIVPIADTQGPGRRYWLQGRTSPENTTTDIVIRSVDREEPARTAKPDVGYFEIALPEGVYEVLCITQAKVVRLPEVRVGPATRG